MLSLTEIAWFALASVLLALTPGPNMIYCVSRTLIQGRRAGLVSLGGVMMAFLAHLFAAALTAIGMGSLPVDAGPPNLVAVLDTPRGPVTLESQGL